jgi:hypothetical protein
MTRCAACGHELEAADALVLHHPDRNVSRVVCDPSSTGRACHRQLPARRGWVRRPFVHVARSAGGRTVRGIPPGRDGSGDTVPEWPVPDPTRPGDPTTEEE